MTVRCASCETRFAPSREACPRCGHRRPGSAGPAGDRGRLIGAAVTVFLASVWVLSILAGGWTATSSADARALAGSQTMAELERGFDELAAAEEALEGERRAEAREHLDRARTHLASADNASEAEAPRFGEATSATLAEATSLGRRAHDVRSDELAWQLAVAENRTALADAEGTAERAAVLVEANASIERGQRVADEHARLAGELRSFATEHPLVAAALSLPVDEAASERVQARDEAWAERVETATVLTAFTHAPEERETMGEAAAEELAAYSPPRVHELFTSFDADGDGELDPEEAVAFYEWVETHVDYRYDAEDAEPEVEGTAVGDGREGTDYQQSPLETVDERFGDCEDTSVLHLAFYEHWGETAYLGLTNTEKGDGITHATALVRVDDLDAYPEPEAGFHRYTFEAGNEHDVEPGTYLIVDDTYSDTYGTISGGVDEGTFEIQGVETLAESLQLSDDWQGPQLRG